MKIKAPIKKIAAILLALWFLPQMIQAAQLPKMFPAEVLTTRGNKEGYINASGEWVVEAMYDQVLDTTNGIGIVVKNAKYGGVDEKNNKIIPLIYDEIRPYKEQRAVYIKDQQWGILDTKGNEISVDRYENIHDFSNGLALVEREIEGKKRYGYINQQGEEVIPAKYLQAEDFIEKKTVVKDEDGSYLLIDIAGKTIENYGILPVSGYREDRLIYEDLLTRKKGYMDEKGNPITTAKYEFAEPFKDGVAVFGEVPEDKGERGLIDLKGNTIYPPIYQQIKNLGSQRVALGIPKDQTQFFIGTRYALADTEGRALTDFIYDDIGVYQGRNTYVYTDEVSYLIDRNGTKLPDFPFVRGSGPLIQIGDIVQGDIDDTRIYFSETGQIIYQPNWIIPLSNTREVETKTFRLGRDYIVYYPKLLGLEEKGVEQTINNRLMDSSMYDKLEETREPFRYISRYSIPFYQGDLLVIDQQGELRFLDQVRPTLIRTTSNINLETGTFYSLEDLFKPNVDWQRVLIDEMNILREQPPIKGKIFEGNPLTLLNNYGFYVDETHLFIYYYPNIIAPFDAGYITFKIPFTQLETIINKEGSFWQAFH